MCVKPKSGVMMKSILPASQGRKYTPSYGGTRVNAALASAIRQHHDDRTDDKNTWDDGETKLNTVLTAVNQGRHGAHGDAALTDGALALRKLDTVIIHLISIDCVLFFTELTGAGDEQQASRENAAQDGAKATDSSGKNGVDTVGAREAQDSTDNNHADTEAGTEVNKRRNLIALEITHEATVVNKGADCGIIRQECRDSTYGSCTRQTKKRFHQRSDQLIEHSDDAKLSEQRTQGSAHDGNRHNIEAGVQEQRVRRLHESGDHVGGAHNHSHGNEQHAQANKAANPLRGPTLS